MNDQSRLIASLSYITIIGWIVALILRQSEKPQSELGLFHLRQSFGLMAISFAASLIKIILAPMGLGLIANLVFLAVFVLWVLGLIGAVQGKFYKVPFIGAWLQENLRFIG